MSDSALIPPNEKQFLAIAHRGASRYAPENTMSAFRKAHKMGADMIELDVQLSKDGIPVVFHDAKLENHSNGKGLVSSFLFDELQQLDAGKWFSDEFIGEKIPSLYQVLDWACDKILVNIEIKTEAVKEAYENGIEKKVIELVRQTGMEKYIIISSFDYRAVERIKKMEPDILTGLLYFKKESGKRGPVELLIDYQADFFHCGKSEMGRNWREKLDKEDKRFLIYTVNRKKAMRIWLKKGAFGIFTDKPDVLKAEASEFFSKTA